MERPATPAFSAGVNLSPGAHIIIVNCNAGVQLREEFERSHQEMTRKYEQRLQELRDDLELRRKV